MPSFTDDFHNAELSKILHIGQRIGNRVVSFLKINPRQTNGIEVLDFIKRCHNRSIIVLTQQLKSTRWKYKSNTIVFHTIEGGALPTPTHQWYTLIRY